MSGGGGGGGAEDGDSCHEDQQVCSHTLLFLSWVCTKKRAIGLKVEAMCEVVDQPGLKVSCA